ncbi:hypothetical protein H2248_003281 [Termitomyces sp. 'cryptogamus']|nr:hypothetical protein H2248_003281 [Termitomyces sp. 'cryptogamus']
MTSGFSNDVPCTVILSSCSEACGLIHCWVVEHSVSAAHLLAELTWLSIGTGSKHRLIEGDFNETKHESPGLPLPEQQLSLFFEGAHQFERMEANERYQHSHQAYDGAEVIKLL